MTAAAWHWQIGARRLHFVPFLWAWGVREHPFSRDRFYQFGPFRLWERM